MILAAHQPDLLPWSGFWFKMAKADLFDVAIHDQFQSRGYQRRVKMRDTWASLPLADDPNLCPITKVRLAPNAKTVLRETIIGRYRNAEFWPLRGLRLLSLIDDAPSDLLWAFNLSLILGVRSMLGISTPIGIASPPVGRGNDGLVSLCRYYDAQTYLSGTGGMAYMGDLAEFKAADVDVVWSAHRPVERDSVVTVLMDYDDPLGLIMEEGTPR